MTANETLDATYKVYNTDVLRPAPHDYDDDHPNRNKLNYIEATNRAIDWMKNYPSIIITDGRLQIIIVGSNGVQIKSSESDLHHEEHLKIQAELEKAWREIHSNNI